MALNPLTEVSVKPTGEEVFPSATLTEGAEKLIVKVGVAAVTVSATVAVFGEAPSAAAVIVTVAEPTAAVLDAEKVRVLDPAPGAAMLAGAKLAVTPVGNPVAERATAELKPPEVVTAMLTGAVPERVTLTVDGVAVSPRPDAGAVTVSATVAVFGQTAPGGL